MIKTKTLWWLLLEIEERMRVSGDYRSEHGGFVIPLSSCGSYRLVARSGAETSTVGIIANGVEHEFRSHHFNGNNFVLYQSSECWPQPDDEVRVEFETAIAGRMETRVYLAGLLVSRWCESDVLLALERQCAAM